MKITLLKIYIYFGSVKPLIKNTRVYDGKYEIDIAKIKRVASDS